MSDTLSPADIPVMILCGGKGTRIGSVSETLPKPMLPIGNHPIVWHIMRSFHAAGYRRFILCLGWKAQEFKEYFLNYTTINNDMTIRFSGAGTEPDITYHPRRLRGPDEMLDWEISLVDTGVEAMTGARVSRALPYVKAEHFILTYGDGLSDIPFVQLAAQHQASGKALTISGVQPAARFGKLELNGDDIVSFEEKPQTRGDYISGGFMVAETKAIEPYLDENNDGLVFEVDVLPRLAADRRIGIFRHDGFWMPMDTPTEFRTLNAMWAEDRAPWKTW